MLKSSKKNQRLIVEENYKKRACKVFFWGKNIFEIRSITLEKLITPHCKEMYVLEKFLFGLTPVYFVRQGKL